MLQNATVKPNNLVIQLFLYEDIESFTYSKSDIYDAALKLHYAAKYNSICLIKRSCK